MSELLSLYGVEAVSAGELGLGRAGRDRARPFAENARIKSRCRGESLGAYRLRRRFGSCGRCARRRARHSFGALGRAGQEFHARDGGDRFHAARSRRDHARASHRAFRLGALRVLAGRPCGRIRGRVDGTLVWPPRGDKGFGYDPMFLPDGHDRTFGEMSSDEKHGLAAARTRPVASRARVPETRGGVPCPLKQADSLRRLSALAVLPVEMSLLRLQQPCAPCRDR